MRKIYKILEVGIAIFLISGVSYADEARERLLKEAEKRIEEQEKIAKKEAERLEKLAQEEAKRLEEEKSSRSGCNGSGGRGSSS